MPPQRHEEVARILLEHGTDMTVQDKNEWTPFDPCLSYQARRRAHWQVTQGRTIGSRQQRSSLCSTILRLSSCMSSMGLRPPRKDLSLLLAEITFGKIPPRMVGGPRASHPPQYSPRVIWCTEIGPWQLLAHGPVHISTHKSHIRSTLGPRSPAPKAPPCRIAYSDNSHIRVPFY